MEKQITMEAVNEARRFDTVQEDAERNLRKVINFQTKMSRTEKEVADQRERLDEKEAARRAARREFEAKRRENLTIFLTRNFWSVILAAIICLLDVFGLMNFWLCLTIMLLACAYLFVNFYAFINRNNKKDNKEACA